MVVTPSTMLPLGTQAPPFSLPEPLTGSNVSLSDVVGEHGVLVAFICNHCPFVVHLESQLEKTGKELAAMGVGMVGISANDVTTHPADAPDKMAEMAKSKWTSFRYLYDESQDVAKSYKAACTPDFFLFDKDLKLVYRGQIDESRPGNNKPITGSAISAAAKLLVEGKPIPESSMKPSIGCNIKWRSGSQPNY